MASSLPSSPEGIVIHRHWRIGKKIGNGACGSVHELVHEKDRKETKTEKRNTDGVPLIHAIKLAQLPDPNSKTKSKESVRRKNHADILHYEALVYQNHLVDLRGTLIPELPLRPVTGDAEGYRFLILERMAAPFDKVVSDIASGKRSFATVASHLISLVEAVHTRKLLVIDIKPDNFMVSPAGKIVMIDLGLVQSYATLGGHRANNTGGAVVGTPLYASLHLFEGETASRRDDLEALFYVLMELVLSITAGKELPWSHGQSEDEIGSLKKYYMLESNGSVWKTLSVAGPALRSFFEQVNSLGYATKPDYDGLRLLFQNIEIGRACQKKKARPTQGSTPAAMKGSAAKATQGAVPLASTTSGRTTATSRRAAEGIASDITTKKRASPNKLVGRPSKKQDVARNVDDFHSIQDSDIESDFQTCNDDSMDWEPTKDRIGVTLHIVTGSHKGEMLNLIHGEQDTVVFGRRPQDPHEYLLSGDPSIDLAHAQVTLQVNKTLVTVLVKNLKSSAGTLVDKTILGPGKSQKAFINDTIVLGETSIKVVPLKPEPKLAGFTSRFQTTGSPEVHMQESTEKENATPNPTTTKVHAQVGTAARPRGFRLEFTAGPYLGATILLQDGSVDTIVLGGNPHSKSGNVFRLNRDPSITDASHVRLELDASRKGYCSLRAIDLKSTQGFRLNGIQVGKGKKETAFANDSLVVGNSVVQIKPL